MTTPTPIPTMYPSLFTDPELSKQIQQVEQDLLTAGYARSREILTSQENQFLAAENRQNRNNQMVMDGIGTTQTLFMDGNGKTQTLFMDGLNRTQAQVGALSSQAERLQNENANSFGRLSAQAERIQNENANSFGNLTKELLKVSIDQAKDHALTQKSVSDAERILERQASDYLNLTNSKFGHLEVQAANNAAAIQLETLRAKSDLMQKMTEYYGDLKDKVSSSEDNIKSLIKSTDTDRLRDALLSSETKNTVFESRGFNVGHFDWHHGHHGHYGHHGHHHHSRSRSRGRGRD